MQRKINCPWTYSKVLIRFVTFGSFSQFFEFHHILKLLSFIEFFPYLMPPKQKWFNLSNKENDIVRPYITF